ncbi:helix-turn-helix domain-containing protein [Chloroflexota bacterium]
MSVPETAKILSLSRNKTYELARLGNIPTLRLDWRILVHLAALEELLKTGNSRITKEY